MKRRTLITTGLVGSSTILAGCSGDPSGIISEDPESDTGSGESVDGDQANNDDSEEEDQSTNNLFERVIETTIEGTGQSLREISIENSGIVLVSVDTKADLVEISILNSNEEEEDSIEIEGSDPFTKTVLELPPDDYAVDIQTQGNWSITIEQYPVVSESDADTEFPIEIEGNTVNVFGPHVLNGFYRPVVQTNGSMAIHFYDENGFIIDDIMILQDLANYDASPVELDPINIDSVCWILCIVVSTEDREEEDELYYNFRLEEPE